MQDAEPMKIFVLTYDHESVVPRVAPNCTIGGGRKANVTDVEGTGVQVSDRPNEARREILVEQ